VPKTSGGDNWGKGSSGSWRDKEVDKTKTKRVRGPLAHSLAADKIAVHKDPPIFVRKVVRGNRRSMRFASLHHHSTFSLVISRWVPDARGSCASGYRVEHVCDGHDRARQYRQPRQV
jgi:hypothetical protein